MALNSMDSVNVLNSLTGVDLTDKLTLANKYKARPELFYQKQLLDTIRYGADQYVHYRLADQAPIQGNAEKLQLRRWSPLQAHTVPLTEGVPPISDKGSVEAYEFDTNQYGRFMEFSDKVDFEVIDPVIAHYTKEYSIVAIETFDLLAREALMSVANPFYAQGNGTVEGFGDITIDCVPTLTDLRKIVLTMKKNLVKPRSNGRYQVIGTPEFFYDMISDPTVEKYMSINQSTYNMYDTQSKLVPLFDMEFYEAPTVMGSGEFETKDGEFLRVYRPKGDGTYEYANVPAQVQGGATYKVANAAGYVQDKRTGYDASYIPAGAKGFAQWDLDAYNAANQGAGAPWEELKVHPILVVGAEALIRTSIAGKDNAKMYVKAKGSSGVLDPIDQRQSIGFKIDAVGFGVVRSEAVHVYYCVPTNANMF